jgi:DNA repair exonuclease SbcCD ATPase subunit
MGRAVSHLAQDQEESMTDKQNVAETVARKPAAAIDGQLMAPLILRWEKWGHEAADLIEALAARLAEVEADRDRWVKNASDIAKDYEAALVERDRLREERDELDFILHEGGDDSVAKLIAERDRMAAELRTARAALADAGALRDAANRVSEWFRTEASYLEGPRIQGLRQAMIAYDQHVLFDPGETS